MKPKIIKVIISFMLTGAFILPSSVFASVIEEDFLDADGYIYGNAYATPAHGKGTLSSNVNLFSSPDHECPNYAHSTEVFELYYVGEIAFRANHLTNSTCGSGLKSGKHVKQGGIDYKRNNQSVIGGTKYTSVAPNESDSTLRSASASCWDDLFNWDDSATTYFYRYWFYF